MAGPAIRHGRDAGHRRLQGEPVAEEAMDAVFTGMFLMAEGEGLERSTVPKIERQSVHHRQPGEDCAHCNGQPGKKLHFFHAVHQKRNQDMAVETAPLSLLIIVGIYGLSNRQRR